MTTAEVYDMAHKQLNTFHLFAGAGGGILADILLGHNPIGACEIEEYPRNVLLARQRDGILPEFPIWDDVQTLDGRPWRGLVDVVAGGFPCQGVSIANDEAKGLDDDRSGLWYHQKRIISEMEPRIAFVENSPMLIRRGLGRVICDLSEIGYICRWLTWGGHETGSCADGKRIWIYATKANSKRRKTVRTVQTIEPYSTASSKRQFSRAISATWSEEHHTRMRRDTNEMARGMERLKAVGNGQDPFLAATAFSILSEGLI